MQPLLCDLLPVFDGEYFAALASRILHVGSAAVLVGGLFYLRLVVAPQIAKGETSAEQVFGTRRRAWGLAVMATTVLLLATGFYNLFMVIIWPNESLPPLYHMLFGMKFLLALVLFFVAAAIGGKSGMASKFRGSLGLLLNLSIAVALAILVLAAVMRSIPKTPAVADELVATANLEHESLYMSHCNG